MQSGRDAGFALRSLPTVILAVGLLLLALFFMLSLEIDEPPQVSIPERSSEDNLGDLLEAPSRPSPNVTPKDHAGRVVFPERSDAPPLSSADEAVSRDDDQREAGDRIGIEDQPTEPYRPVFESTEIPRMLGSIGLSSIGELSDALPALVQAVYGTKDQMFLDLVHSANPQLIGVRALPANADIDFPALIPRRMHSATDGYWLSLGRFADLEAAYQRWGEAPLNTGQWELLSGFSPESGLFFLVLDAAAHREKPSALHAAETLSSQIDGSVEVVSNWWKGTLFLTYPPGIFGIAAPDTIHFSAWTSFETLGNAMAENLGAIKFVAPGEVTAPERSNDNGANLERRGRTVRPPEFMPHPVRPPGMHTGAPVRLYNLLSEGIIRDYAIRGADPTTGAESHVQTGFIQVVAHVQRELAEAEAEWFAGHGWPASVFSMEIAGRIYHRVLIGPFATMEDAKAVMLQSRSDVRALEYIQRVLPQALVEPVDNSEQEWRLRLEVEGDPAPVARVLEDYGWPVQRVRDQAVFLGSFPRESKAEGLRKRVVEDGGWGPMSENRE